VLNFWPECTNGEKVQKAIVIEVSQKTWLQILLLVLGFAPENTPAPDPVSQVASLPAFISRVRNARVFKLAIAHAEYMQTASIHSAGSIFDWFLSYVISKLLYNIKQVSSPVGSRFVRNNNYGQVWKIYLQCFRSWIFFIQKEALVFRIKDTSRLKVSMCCVSGNSILSYSTWKMLSYDPASISSTTCHNASSEQ